MMSEHKSRLDGKRRIKPGKGLKRKSPKSWPFPMDLFNVVDDFTGEGLGIARAHIQPGKPQQIANVERFNRTVWRLRLSQFNFATITDIQDVATN